MRDMHSRDSALNAKCDEPPHPIELVPATIEPARNMYEIGPHGAACCRVWMRAVCKFGRGQRALATTRLLTKQIVNTGNQMILSQKLGVAALAIIPSAQ